MPTPNHPNGRVARTLSQQIDWDLAQAKQTLFDVLGSTDSRDYHLAMRDALRHIEAAHVANRDKLQIERDYAKRGSYNKED